MSQNEISLKDKLGSEAFFKVSRFKEVIKRTKPHKHDGYFELICIVEGEGFHQVEMDTYPIQAPELYFLKPNQVHCWQFTAIPKGFVLLFKEEFFDAITEAPILNLIRNLDEISRVSLSEHLGLIGFFEEMRKEYESPGQFSKDIIAGYLRAIFSRILQLSEFGEEDQKKEDTLYRKFQKLLSEKCPELHLVTDFAKLLNTTPQNLNAICRKYSSKSASEHLTDQLSLEAKRYILHTDLSMNEIADRLAFNDASYFTKFFKKRTGKTPLQFKAQYFQ
jgi:AraC family transcriptional regulator, transcriptional activator of pobA